MHLKPSEIRYSQDSIRNYFSDRTTLIGKTLDDICEGRCMISHIPRISVKKINDHLVTADNRRLWVFKHVERLGKCTKIPVCIVTSIPQSKLTSRNNGASIKIRGGASPGGIWHSKLTQKLTNPATSNIYPDKTQCDLQLRKLGQTAENEQGLLVEEDSETAPDSHSKDTPINGVNRNVAKQPSYATDPKMIPTIHKTEMLNLSSQRSLRNDKESLKRKATQTKTSLHTTTKQTPTFDCIDTKENTMRVKTRVRDLSQRDIHLYADSNITEHQQLLETLGSGHRSETYSPAAKKTRKKPATVQPIIAQAQQERLLVAAIDFGTTFSGYAFSFYNEFKENPLKIVTNRWRTGSNQNLSLKTSSCILFNPEQKFHSFGFDAEDMYAELATDERHIDWYYFKQFKMLLYENKDLSRGTLIEDNEGKQMKALTVFIESIKFLKHHFLKTCTDRYIGLNEDDIHWVLTVPAIWDDSAKQFMREAAIEAGIDSHHLLLALEPEAASMFCNYLPVNKIQGANVDRLSSFKPGTKYMVLDAGGGTVDITVHETQGGHTVRELFKANGGPWGGSRVDEAFHKFLAEISSEETLQQFKVTHMEDYLDIMREFENKKATTSPELDRTVTFNIPVSYLGTYAGLHHKELRINNLVGHPLKEKVTFTGNKLRIQPEVIQGFFTEPCDAIVSHLKGIFSQRAVRNTNTVLMVGGFSESRMLQDAIRRNFPDKQVIIPEEAGLAVLKGAVIYGHNPTVITSRISRFTYGVGTNVPFNSVEHPRTRYLESEGKAYCAKVFDRHVNVGTEVKEGLIFQAKTYLPLHSHSSSLTIEIFTSDQKDPSYVDESGCQLLGCVRVDLSNIVLESDKAVEVCMKYGGTELRVEAKVIKTGLKVNAEFEFL